MAGFRPDLIQTEPVPSTGHGQHTPRVTAQSRLSGHTPHTPRVTVGVPVSGHRLTRKPNKNKLNKKIKIRKTNYRSPVSSMSSSYKKPKKCQPVAGVRPDLIQTESVPSSGHGQHTPRVTALSRSRLSGYTTHTPRVTVEVPVSTGHGQHTPRVTAQTGSRLTGHTTHTPRVTVMVPVSCHRLTRKQNKNKPNEKMKNTKTSNQSHRKLIPLFLDSCSDVSLPVANKLLCSVVSLSVANKLAIGSVKHPDDKWLTDVLTKTSKCQPAVRDTLVTVPHTPRVTVGVPDSRLARQQNKNKQNTKHKNQKSNYLSNVTLVESVKLTKWFNHGHGYLVIPHILRESLWRSLSALVMASILRESLLCHGHGYLVIPHILRESLWRSLSALVTASILRESLHKQSQVTLHTNQYNLTQVSTKSKKCQPDAGDRPDLIQTEPVPSTGLARSKSNYLSHVTLASIDQSFMVKYLRSQPSGHGAAVMGIRSQLSGHDTAVTTITSTAHSLPDSGLTRSKNDNYIPDVTLVRNHKRKFKYFFSISRKRRNKLIKQLNGNGKKMINICHWNLGSKNWIKKRNQIQALADQLNPDILVISEANLNPGTPLYESQIMGYQITFPKSTTINLTARVILLTKDELNIKVEENLMEETFSSIWIKLSIPGNKSVLICGAYREHQYLCQTTDWSLHPDEQAIRWNIFLKQVERASATSICHLLGDFNLDFNRWNTPDQAHKKMVEDSKQYLEAGGFLQFIHDITRSWPGQVDSTIDHFWSNAPERVSNTSNLLRTVGDHNVITALVRVKGVDVRRLDVRRRSFKNFDPVVYRSRLKALDWTKIYDISDVNLANNFIEEKIVNILDELCPYKTVQARKQCKTWLSCEAKQKMEERDNICEAARLSGDPASWDRYRKLRNKVNNDVDRDRKKHYSDIYTKLQNEKNVGAIYRAAKDQAGWKSNSSPTSFLSDGKIITDPKSMADLQMTTFTNKTNKLLNDLPPRTSDPCKTLKDALENWGKPKDDRGEFKIKPISRLELLKIITKMGNSTSSGIDSIDALAIKHCAAILHEPITHMVNQSILTSTFASKWKIGKLLPLHKGKGLPKSDLKSFRPILMLPILGKITERAIQCQIMDFMEKSGQINENHHSYRKLHSTVTTMLQISDTIFEGVNENKIATVFTIDQSSAFDVIDHKILRQKLKLYNFGSSALEWIESYLSHRSHFVSIGTKSSAYNNVTHGVPQGSVLGLILYVIYVNELPAVVNEDDSGNKEHSDDEKLFTDNCKAVDHSPPTPMIRHSSSRRTQDSRLKKKS